MTAEAAIEYLEVTIDKMRETLGLGVEVKGLDKYLDELSNITPLKDSVDKLVDALGKLEFPELSESVKVEGLDSLLQSLKNQKPQIITTSDKQTLTTITTHIDKIVKEISRMSVKSQNVEDYTPIRRVRKLGNRLVFDDGEWSGTSYGGSSSDFDRQVAVNTDGTIPISKPIYKTIVDDSTTANVTYIGQAALGTATTAASWRIQKVDTTSGTVITWSGLGFSVKWSERATVVVYS